MTYRPFFLCKLCGQTIISEKDWKQHLQWHEDSIRENERRNPSIEIETAIFSVNGERYEFRRIS